MEFPERAECDFSHGRPYQTKPEQQLEMFLPDVTCMHCRKVVPQPFYVEKYFDKGGPRHLPFCNEEHSQQYYMKSMREGGAL